jgi:predicted transcriptional regulator
MRNAMTRKFEFGIIASGLDPSADDFETRFFDAGCDDATVSFQKGRIIVDFAREASSIDAAIASAVECVKAAGATVERIEPDPLVNLSDIAARTGLTRAAVSQYSTGDRREDFPLPVARVTTTTPLWDWADVAVWFYRHNQLDRETAVEAMAITVANSLVGERRFGRALKEHLKDYEAELEPTENSRRAAAAKFRGADVKSLRPVRRATSPRKRK